MLLNDSHMLSYAHDYSETSQYTVYRHYGKKHLYSKKSLFCCVQENPVRKTLAYIVNNPWFDHFITICIIANSALLAARDYRGNYIENYQSDVNNFID